MLWESFFRSDSHHLDRITHPPLQRLLDRRDHLPASLPFRTPRAAAQPSCCSTGGGPISPVHRRRVRHGQPQGRDTNPLIVNVVRSKLASGKPVHAGVHAYDADVIMPGTLQTWTRAEKASSLPRRPTPTATSWPSGKRCALRAAARTRSSPPLFFFWVSAKLKQEYFYKAPSRAGERSSIRRARVTF